MDQPISHYRMAENEVIFRTRNERVQQGLEEIKRIAKEDNQTFFIDEDDTPLHFYCECADEDCQKRIRLSPSTYNRIHLERDQFIVAPKHQVAEIEIVVETHPNYQVVKKRVHPPETAPRLHDTPLKNT